MLKSVFIFSNKEVYLPVKITEPITSILYITSDKNHMELIKDTLHVHKIVEGKYYFNSKLLFQVLN